MTPSPYTEDSCSANDGGLLGAATGLEVGLCPQPRGFWAGQSSGAQGGSGGGADAHATGEVD